MDRREAQRLFGPSLGGLTRPTVDRASGEAEASLTLWTSDTALRDRGEEVTTTWRTVLEDFARRRRFLGAREHPGWTPAVFSMRVRTRGAVRGVSALIIAIEPSAGIDAEAAARAWDDYYGTVVSTPAHATAAHSLTIVLPFAELLPVEGYVAAARRAATRLRSIGWTDGVSIVPPWAFRYLPAAHPGRPYVSRILAGDRWFADAVQ